MTGPNTNPFTVRRKNVHPLARIDYDVNVLWIVCGVGWALMLALAVAAQWGYIL